MVAGWQARDSTPPRLSANVKTDNRPTNPVHRLPAAFELEGNHPGEARHLALRNCVPRVIGEPLGIQGLHARATLQCLGYGERVGLVTLHAHGKRFQPALHEEAVERGGHGARRVLVEPAGLPEVVAIRDERSADDVRCGRR